LHRYAGNRQPCGFDLPDSFVSTISKKTSLARRGEEDDIVHQRLMGILDTFRKAR
jgi:hypothetical protein